MFLFRRKKIDIEEITKDIYKKYRVKRYFMLFVGLFCIAFAFNMFLLPHDIVFGGVSGLSIITQKVFNWVPSMFILVSSVILLLVSYLVLGKKTTRASVLGSLLLPVFIEITSKLSDLINFNSNDMILISIFGGLLYGFGAGLVFKAGFTTGGTDIINQIISLKCKVSMGKALIMSDGLIVLGGVFIFGFEKLLFALIVLYLISLMTDKVLLGISDAKAFYIIAEKYEDIREYILNELGHGITIFEAKGGYKYEKQKVLFCVIPTKEYFKVKEGISEIDDKAFLVVTDAYEVMGGE